MNSNLSPFDRAKQTSGKMLDEELIWLLEVAKKANNVIEVGVLRGKTTIILAQARGTVISIDIWNCLSDYEQFKENLAQEIKSGKVLPMKMGAAEASDILRSKINTFVKPDLIFIDANHSYAAVKQDILCYLPFVKKGGILCGHDFTSRLPGVKKAVMEVIKDYKRAPGTLWYIEVL